MRLIAVGVLALFANSCVLECDSEPWAKRSNCEVLSKNCLQVCGTSPNVAYILTPTNVPGVVRTVLPAESDSTFASLKEAQMRCMQVCLTERQRCLKEEVDR